MTKPHLHRSFIVAFILALLFSISARAESPENIRQVGVASIDVTPNFPVRLNGYFGRNVEATNAVQHLFGKALAIGSDSENPAILITLENCILPHGLRDEVARRLHERAGIAPERIAICVTHTHTAPCLTGAAPNLFGMDLPASDQAHIDRYTREVIDKLERVALAALKDRRPSTLAWGQDEAKFAANRRTKGGPVDDALPFLVVTDTHAKLRAILANYACHCTTLGSTYTNICGDWAGYAQEYLQQKYPGATVLVAIGCGADANPNPRGTLALAEQHGREFADAVDRALAFTPAPLRGKLECRTKEIELPFDTLPTRVQWEMLAKQNSPVGYQARKNLKRLDRGEKLETQIPYLVQTWNFGDDLGMVFLSGEVVVDYSLRLKKEFDSSRLWINAYANDIPGYIPSERVLKEGGYEGGGAMVYYDHPTKFAPGLENKIVATVHELLPAQFILDEKQAQSPPAKSPQDSLAALRTKAGLKIELVASEPLIESPVYIDFGADGRMWLVEMRDYPAGMDGNWKPGGRIKYLESTHHDGHYDKATIFLDNIPFPTGVMPWRDGALVCTAPDILFAESSKGVGMSDSVKKILSGFYTDNYQARVNGLNYGLDNWIYGANGLLGGVIHGMANATEVDIRGRDFRMNPDTGVFEPAAGITQQGRARDDWGNWFGCDNSNPLWDYPLPDHYIRRNPFVTAPTPRFYSATGQEPNRVYPISHMLERFNEPNAANHITSGCGVAIYRDNLLGEQFYGNAFTCEPVGNLVYRLQLSEDENGALVTGSRAADEQDADFLASRDNWSRPVQVRTGPDGALYVVDMYRFVIEHPRWIGKERLAQLDVRAGADKGRIYRIVPADKKLRPVPSLKKLSTAKLVAALDTPNGTLRDLVHIELIQRGDLSAVQLLSELARKSKLPAVRIQALCVLDGMKGLLPGLLVTALADSDVHVRRQAIRLSESRLASTPELQDAVLKLSNDPGVSYQLALSLGEWSDVRAGQALGKIAQAKMGDDWVRAAVLSSAVPHTVEILKRVLTASPDAPGRNEIVKQLIATAVGKGDPETFAQILGAVVPKDGGTIEEWQFAMLKNLLDALHRKKQSLASLIARVPGDPSDVQARIDAMFDAARKLAVDSSDDESLRATATSLLGQDAAHHEADLQLLGNLLQPSNPLEIQKTAVATLQHDSSPKVPELLLADWKQLSPSLRTRIIEVLLSREESTKALLAAIQTRTVQANEVPAASAQRLFKHSNPEIKKLAETLLSTGPTSSRADVMTRYQDVSAFKGDAANGSKIFAKNCTPCHLVKGQGNAVGPDLALLRDKTPGDFLLAIIDPNAAVEPRFLAYDIETRDDRSLVGVISAETSTSLTLIQPGGIQEKILRSDVKEIKATGLSLMPEGFETSISKQELADLIAYLKSVPAPFGSGSPERADAALAKFQAEGNSLARVSGSEEITYGSWLGNVTMEHCRETDGRSKVDWESTPVPNDLKPGASQKFLFPAAMGWFTTTPGKFTLSINGKPVLDFDVALNDASWQSADGRVQMNYTVMENNADDSNGVLAIEVPNALLEPGKPAVFNVTGSASGSQRWFGVYKIASK
jgi:putative membrane-bound dehydrogenase-like protein